MNRIEKIILLLEEVYPNARLKLNYKNPLQLLIASILAAQCTDERVNKVTADLFNKYTAVKDFAEAKNEELEKDIKPTGFFRNKAKNIINACKLIIEQHNGEVPESKEKLLLLPGVADKTANMISCNAFSIASGIVVDTHVKRIAYRLDLSKNTNPVKIEKDLINMVPRNKWISFPHLVAFHGRNICKARKPKCFQCSIKDLCYSTDKITCKVTAGSHAYVQ
ncbi:MAG: endonuclease III [Candidatus Fischerbacteria bacterium RBG_13_37_8]|uniref:Endonuclease III n=1 Tax=Candidatus Fischerbacteria bacterium RBG_13_37_8 TaxID=1817863 RepID=A0A1F5V5J7_9BACT|nr:MAG: endonuclease III [Candidatus Fischerbacteria bacterium RBG_13_37_8]